MSIFDLIATIITLPVQIILSVLATVLGFLGLA